MKELRGGRYVLLETLGEGAQGETWSAVDKREGRQVAVKAFRVGRAKSWKDVELAERETRTLATLSHPSLPRYLEHFEEDGTLYLVMEKIEGESLAALKKRGGALRPGEVRRLLEDASRALGYLHGHAPPIVHRDLKPANVVRRSDGSFAFVDFGSVRDRLKPEGGSTVVGTFGFMAPEQFQGRASPASDVYGVGATALTMLTGTEPEDLPHKGLAIDVASAVPKGTPRALVATLEAMLDPDPDARAPSVSEALRRGRARAEDEGEAAEGDAKRSRRERHLDEHRKRRERHRREQRERHRRRRERRRRSRARAPFLPRLVARLSLLFAQLVVWLTVGFAVPVVLLVLSAIFGPGLRRAARACFSASKRASAALGRTQGWLAGRGEDETAEAGEEARVRVAPDVASRVRAVTPDEAQELADRMTEQEALEWADERASREAAEWEAAERAAKRRGKS